MACATITNQDAIYTILNPDDHLEVPIAEGAATDIAAMLIDGTYTAIANSPHTGAETFGVITIDNGRAMFAPEA